MTLLRRHVLVKYLAIVWLSYQLRTARGQAGQEEICIQDGSCYPRIFEPSEDWKLILPDQELPGGLHIRMNLETGRKEAKLLDKDEPQQVEGDGDIVIFEHPEDIQEEESAPSLDVDSSTQSVPDSIFDEPDFEQHHKPNPHIAFYDHESLAQSLNRLQEFKEFHDGLYGRSERKASNEFDYEALDDALDNLVDLSHEMDFGIQISEEVNFRPLQDLVETTSLPSYIRDKAARIIGASLRNNPIALKKVLTGTATKAPVQWLVKVLGNEKDINMQGRLVYALGSLVQSNQGLREFQSNNGHETLQKVFRAGSDEVMAKCATFVEDRFLARHKRDQPQSKSEQAAFIREKLKSQPQWPNDMTKWSEEFQTALTGGNVESFDTRLKIFTALTSIHQILKDTQVSQEFLQWISRETQDLAHWSDHETRDSTSEEDSYIANVSSQYFDELKKARHDVFGNPKAARKMHYDL